MKTAWSYSSDNDKKSVWTYFEKLDSEIVEVYQTIGLKAAGPGETQITLKDYLLGLKKAISEDVLNASRNNQDSTVNQMANLIEGFKIAEERIHDAMHEVIGRLRFATDRIKAIEEALGIGYVDDLEVKYSGYFAKEYPVEK